MQVISILNCFKEEYIDAKDRIPWFEMCNISESFKVIKRNCNNGNQHSILHASVTYISHTPCIWKCVFMISMTIFPFSSEQEKKTLDIKGTKLEHKK